MGVSHEEIEFAFVRPAEVIGKLPDTTETREAKRLLGTAENLAHEVRERTGPITAEEAPCDASP